MTLVPDDEFRPSRRDLLKIGGSLGAFLAVGGLPAFTANAEPARPEDAELAPASGSSVLWYPQAAVESRIIEEGLPVGNGRLGALVTGDPAQDALYLTDVTLWTGGLNANLQDDGNFPYEGPEFGTLSLLAKVYVKIPAHASPKNYRRRLDMGNGLVTASYQIGSTTYRREVYVSQPDDVMVVRLSQSGGGSYTGSVTLDGTHGETTTADAGTKSASFSGKLPNGLRYGAVLTASSRTGKVSVSGATVTFDGCSDVLIVLSGGTDYAPVAADGFRNPRVDPLALAKAKARTATAAGAAPLLGTHVADYQALFRRMTVDLGPSSKTQRSLDTAARLAARAAPGSAPDPELEAGYLQFGRYLTITGSRGSLPTNLQGLWLDRNDPAWKADYHTDINVQMNYWLPDRAGLSDCFDAYADYCLSQLSSWTTQTQLLFNDPRNGFRNTNGKIAGWTTAISTNIHGGMGWWWHPAGNAWLCNSLFEHYEFVPDLAYLRKIYPMLKGACEFWEARLLTTTVTDVHGVQREVLIDDSDWSPEQGPINAKGITYAQELVWQLFQNFRDAAAALRVDSAYAKTISDLQDRLYLPAVSPATGKLQEWMADGELGEQQHRHLSPLIGFYPGDRITADKSPAPLVSGVRELLISRGMESFGWACAWRALCWARLKDADKAYQLILTVMKPSVNFSNGAAINMFDMYSFGGSSTFQIDANYGTPTAMLEMLTYSRPGVIELLPALPGAWAASGRVTGMGARGGFTVDLEWSRGKVTSATIHSVGGTSTVVKAGTWSQTVKLAKGRSVTVRPR